MEHEVTRQPSRTNSGRRFARTGSEASSPHYAASVACVERLLHAFTSCRLGLSEKLTQLDGEASTLYSRDHWSPSMGAKCIGRTRTVHASR